MKMKDFTVVYDTEALKNIKMSFKAENIEDAIDWVENGGYLSHISEYKILDENDEVVFTKK